MKAKNNLKRILVIFMAVSMLIGTFDTTYSVHAQDETSYEETEDEEIVESDENSAIIQDIEGDTTEEDTSVTEEEPGTTEEENNTTEEDTDVILEDNYIIYFRVEETNQETYSTSYTGQAICPEIIVINKSDEQDVLDISSDDSIYTVEYLDNTDAGTATVKVYETLNEENFIAATFDIKPLSISNAAVSLTNTSYVYKGSAIKPTPTVVYGDKTLNNNTDYVLSYKNNNGIGTATCTVTGQGNYTGSISVTFKLTLNKAKITSLTTAYNKITVKWEKTPGADKFVIYRSTKENSGYKKIATVTGTSKNTYSDTNVTIGKKYYYKVYAYSGSACTKSDAKSKTVLPSRVTISSAVSKNYKTTKITWNKVAGATGYYIYRSKSENGSYTKIATVKKDQLTYEDTGLTTGVTYYYKIKAYRSTGGKKYAGASSVASAVAAVPSKPKISKCSFSSGNITLKWGEVSGATGYYIYRSTSKTSGYSKIATVSKSTTKYTDKYLPGGKTYYYKVVAYRKVNGKKVLGKYSSVSSVKTKFSRTAVVNLAKSWLGIKEKSSGHKQILSIYNSHTPLARDYTVKTSDAWCATFVSAVFIKQGYTKIMPTECSCKYLVELLKDMGCWEENDSYVPKAGDVIFYDWDDTTGSKRDNTGTPDHVGIVEKVVGNKITVIEGNYCDKVKRRVIQVNGKYIRGYGVPNYNAG